MTFGRIKRAALAPFALALLALSASSGCRGDEASNANTNGATAPAGNAPRVTVRAGAPAPPAELQPLPASVADAPVKTLDGKTIKLSDYRGKVLVLDLWATWCRPCRDEIPHLIALGKEFGPKGVEVVGLTTEDPEIDREKVEEFTKDLKIDYTVGWADNAYALTLMAGRSSIPQTFVITRDGRVAKRMIGFSPVSSPPVLRQAVETALSMN